MGIFLIIIQVKDDSLHITNTYAKLSSNYASSNYNVRKTEPSATSSSFLIYFLNNSFFYAFSLLKTGI